MKSTTKKNLKAILIFTTIIMLCCIIMIGSSYLYLEISLNSAQTDTNESRIPYASPLPDDVGLLITLPSGSGYMIFLNFKGDSISIAQIDNIEKVEKEYYGYPVSFKIDADYDLLIGLIDRAGGIELYEGGETLRYTGYQIIDKIQTTSQNQELIREVFRRYFDKISEVGITKEDFLYIIEESETDLTVPDCYYWPPYIGEIAENLHFIN